MPHAKISKRSVSTLGMLIGSAATVAFYIMAPLVARYFPGWPEFVQRYFCGHPIEYVTSGLFFVGMGILLVKWQQLPTERMVISLSLIHI